MRDPFADSPEFRALLAGDRPADLTRVALEVARDARPGLDIDAILAQVDELAARARARIGPSARARQVLGHINWILFVEEGYRGDEEGYYDPANSFLDAVIARKLGIPISLSVLYLALADRLDLPMAGVNLPAHFVVRTLGDEPTFVDPFHEGALLDARGCERLVEQATGQAVRLGESALAPCPTPTLVARMLRNLKAVYLRDHRYAEALPFLRRLVALDPAPLERRDLGVLCARSDLPGESMAHLRAYLDARPEADDAATVAELLRGATREVAMRN